MLKKYLLTFWPLSWIGILSKADAALLSGASRVFI